MNRILLALTLTAVQLHALVGGFGAVAAETKSSPDTKPSISATAQAPDPRIPDGPVLSILIRRTLLTLNDANLTGNYTVLRDLGAPGFQSANDAARLAAIFANLRQRKIDLAPIIYFDPKLVREPQIEPNGMLRVSGFIPTQPEQVNFDFLFQLVEGRWRVFGIAVNTSPSAATAVAAPSPTAPPAPPAAKKPDQPAPAKATAKKVEKKKQ